MGLFGHMTTALLLSRLARGIDQPGNVFDEAFDQFIEDKLEQVHVPGISIALLSDGKVASKAYGFARLPDVRANPDTLYCTGSTTKAFVAAAAAKIVLNNTAFPNVQWSTPMSHLLPGDFVLADEYATAHVTIEDALSHRSGMTRFDLLHGWIANGTDLDTVRTMAHVPLNAPLRTKWQYSNLMYNAIGVLLERLTDNRLEDLLGEWLWRPLGMRSTTMSREHARRTKDSSGNTRLAQGYFWAGDFFVPEDPPQEYLLAAGGIYSSVNDYALWMQAILDTYHNANDSSPVTPELVEHVTTGRMLLPTRGVPIEGLNAYALGWLLEQRGSHPVITHGGFVLGYKTSVYLLPHANIGFVSMENAGPQSIGEQVFSEFLRRRGLVSGVDDTNVRVSKAATPPEAFRLETPESRFEIPHSKEHFQVDDLIGTYVHPSFGPVRISRSGSEEASDADINAKLGGQQATLGVTAGRIPKLKVDVGPRWFPWSAEITHESQGVFNLTGYIFHGTKNISAEGCGSGNSAVMSRRNLACRYEYAPETVISESKAVFEHGIDGEIERLGMQLESDLVDPDHPERWRDSMVWFEKQPDGSLLL